MPTAFFTGITGLVAGAFFPKFQKDFPEFKITALIRNPSAFAEVEALGITPVHGSIGDTDVVEKASSEADLVFNIVSARDVENIKAIIRGLTKRSKRADVSKPILIHTSGAFTYADRDDTGSELDVKVWDDNDKEDIATVDIDFGWRRVEAEVANADLAGSISAYTIVPPFIYGTLSNSPPFKNASTAWKEVVLPSIIESRQAVTINKGHNSWSIVHVRDLANLYSLVTKLALSGKDTESGYGKTYFAATKENAVVWDKVNSRVAAFLYSKGIVDLPTVTRKTPEQAPEIAQYFGVNLLVVGNRSATLGWKQVQPQILDGDNLERELELALKEMGILA